ncbi:unnamed protein product [Lymnaea stagnalis]|uniref:Metalloendopeptidase n=1 Tax=Lymnaea stagnalis TaxID=6523 RepID=A0AAV2HA04_LYMST
MKTCVVFVDKAPQHKDYVVFTKLPCGCCAAVGNQRTGPQPISIGDGCEQTGIVLHELGHVIGLSDVTDDIPQASPIHQLINVSNSVNGSAPGTTTKTLESLFNLTMDVIITNDKMKASDTEEERDESISENDSIMRYGEKLFQSKLYSNHPNEVKYVESADFFIELKMKIYVSDVKATNEFYRCPKCGKSFQHPKGNVTHLPLANASAFCQWRIIAGYGETVLFKITGMHFNASCDDTYLEIRDGPSKSSALLEKLCAGSAPLSVTSTGPLMFIEYRSKTGPGEGFEGNYMFLCGGEITVEDKVYLGSPNYPYEYVPNKNCSWKLSAGKGFRIVLRLELFKLEGSENCKSDYLEVRDGATAASKLFGRYCSQSIPSVFISTGENLLVTFVSDGFYQTEGFLGNVVREEIK